MHGYQTYSLVILDTWQFGGVEHDDRGPILMTKLVELSGFEQLLLDQRSDILVYGAPEIFLDGVIDNFSDVSPDATAAKLIADFARMYAALNVKCGAEPTYNRIDVTAPMGRLIEPLISGNSAYLSDADSSAEIFANMLDWVGSTRWFEKTGTGGDENRFLIKGDVSRYTLDGDAIAAWLTLGILLDSADVQIVVDRDLRLDLVHTFRCFSHLFARLDRLNASIGKDALTGDAALRVIFVEGLKCLSSDGVVRDDDQGLKFETTH